MSRPLLFSPVQMEKYRREASHSGGAYLGLIDACTFFERDYNDLAR